MLNAIRLHNDSLRQRDCSRSDHLDDSSSTKNIQRVKFFADRANFFIYGQAKLSHMAWVEEPESRRP